MARGSRWSGNIAEASRRPWRAASTTRTPRRILVDGTAAQLGEDGLRPVRCGCSPSSPTTRPVHLDADEGVWLPVRPGTVTVRRLTASRLRRQRVDDDDGDNDRRHQRRSTAWSSTCCTANGVADLGRRDCHRYPGRHRRRDGLHGRRPARRHDPRSHQGRPSRRAPRTRTATSPTSPTSSALPQVTGLLAEVTDEDGTALTGIKVDWESSDDDVATIALVAGGRRTHGAER